MKKFYFHTLILGTILFGGLNAQLEARESCGRDCGAAYTPCMNKCRELFNKDKPLVGTKYEHCKATCLAGVNACVDAKIPTGAKKQ